MCLFTGGRGVPFLESPSTKYFNSSSVSVCPYPATPAYVTPFSTHHQSRRIDGLQYRGWNAGQKDVRGRCLRELSMCLAWRANWCLHNPGGYRISAYICSFNRKLIPWSESPSEVDSRSGSQEFSAFYGSWRFITVFIRASHWTVALVTSVPHFHTFL
jgi:hypothetical protein